MKPAKKQSELGQFIPLVYHYNMLSDTARTSAFQNAIALAVTPQSTVLDLGGGTAVLSFFSAQAGAKVWCVEKNPELVSEARRILALNVGGERVQVIEADAFDYLPPEPVDVVICEMLHVGMLREQQLAVLASFKRRYLAKFDAPLPRFIPEAFFQAVQPVQQSFEFNGYYAPVPCFQDPLQTQARTVELGQPVIYHSGSYDGDFSLDCSWQGQLAFSQAGDFNAVRIITKNVLAVLEAEQRTLDWTNQYLLVPIEEPRRVVPGQRVRVSFSYQAGDPISQLQPEIGWQE